MRNRIRISLLALVLSLSLQPQQMYAGSFVRDMWNVVTDPFKIGKASATLSQSAERSLIQLQALEGVANAHVSDRLEQMRSILREALNGTEKIVQDATLQMLGLEQQINQDALDFLYKTQCAAEVAATATMQRGFAELITNLRKANPGVKILGIKVAELSADEVTITDPDQAYVSTKDVLINKADKEWNDDTPAFEVLSLYQNLSRAARFVRCHYIGSIHDLQFTREVNELERLSYPWVAVVQVKMGKH